MDPKTLIQTTTRAQRWEEARHGKFMDLGSRFPQNAAVWDMVIKTKDHIREQARWGGKIMVSVSGGSDSDIMLDLFERIGYPEGLVVYVWFDTGLEYDATKRHLKDLEARYGVGIKRYRSKMTVAQAVKRYGVPFLSKMDAKSIDVLQRRGFQWEGESFAVLDQKYPRMQTGLKYWCNFYSSKFCVGRSAGLKEFIMANHPPKISDQCCKFAKKDVAERIMKELGATMKVLGIRRAESGVRAVAYTSCFSAATDTRIAQFRPLFYLTDADKQEYKDFCGVTYSDCYEVWGFTRTGCACCPFGSGFEEELEAVKRYEPKLYATACKIFGPSYEYTRKYRKFKESFKREKRRGGQIDLFDNPDMILEEDKP